MGRPRKDGTPNGDYPDYPPEAVIQPWERQPNETSRAYEAFRIYRELGPGRTFAEVTRQMHGVREEPEGKKKRGRPRTKSHSLVARWAQQFEWRRRSTLWDQEIDRVRLEQGREEIRKMTERHIALAGMMQGKAAKRLRELSDDELAKMNLDQVMKFIMNGTTLERLSRDLPTHRSATEAKVDSEGKDEEAREQIRAAREDFERRIAAMAARKQEAQAIPTARASEDARAAITNGPRPAVAEAIRSLKLGANDN